MRVFAGQEPSGLVLALLVVFADVHGGVVRLDVGGLLLVRLVQVEVVWRVCFLPLCHVPT